MKLLLKIVTLAILISILTSCSLLTHQKSASLTFKTKTDLRIIGDTCFVSLKIKFSENFYYTYVINYYERVNPLRMDSCLDFGVIYIQTDSQIIAIGNLDTVLSDAMHLLPKYRKSGYLPEGNWLEFKFKLKSKFIRNLPIFFIDITDMDKNACFRIKSDIKSTSL
jgi:hypothetical protein